MTATGLKVFDKTLQITNTWLDEIMSDLGLDRHFAWHALGAVLWPVRDRLPADLAAHLGAQLPLLVRGLYYEQWHPAGKPERLRTLDEFLQRVSGELRGTRPADVREVTLAVFRTLSRHADPGQVAKVVDALPEEVRVFWLSALGVAASGAAALAAQEGQQNGNEA